MNPQKFNLRAIRHNEIKRDRVKKTAIPYSKVSRVKTRFKGGSIETFVITIALARAYKRLKVLQAKLQLFRPIVKPRNKAEIRRKLSSVKNIGLK